MTTDAGNEPPVGPVTPRVKPGAHWPIDYEGEFNLPFWGGGFFLFCLGMTWTQQFDAPSTATVVLYAVFGVFTFVCALQLWDQFADIQFRKWILANWHTIIEGNAFYEGQRFNPETPLVRYPVALSLGLIHRQYLGRPVRPGTPAASWARWTAIITTGLAGWWFLFRGPFVTPVLLVQNLRDRPVETKLSEVANATLAGQPISHGKLDA